MEDGTESPLPARKRQKTQPVAPRGPSKATLALRSQPLRVVSIDVGLRNLGLAVVRYRFGGGPSSDSASSFAQPAAMDAGRILFEHIVVEHAENVDLLEENGCGAKNAKSLGPLKQIQFWHACMSSRKALLLDPPPDILVVEVQDGGNATMRQVSTGIVGLFVGHFEARHRDGLIPRVPIFTMVRGDMKMKVCETILESAIIKGRQLRQESIPRIASLREFVVPVAAAAAAAVQSAPASRRPPPEYLKRINPRKYFALLRTYQAQTQEVEGDGGDAEAEAAAGGGGDVGDVVGASSAVPSKPRRITAGRSRAAYEMRKKTAVLAFESYLDWVSETTSTTPTFMHAPAKKRRDISDAVLQGMYVICRHLKCM